MEEIKSNHMGPEEFRRHGHAVIDWIARYWMNVESYPVLSQVQPGDVRARLPSEPPETGESFEAILDDVDRLIMPGITHWQSPNFYAFFPANTSGPAVLGDLVSSGLGVQGMLWATSPACTELETHVLDWLASLLGLPEKFRSHTHGGGVIQDTASSASLCALIAARERATHFRGNEQGVPQGLTVYTSKQAHSSIEKGVKIAGIGRQNLRLIDVDANHAMRPEALDRAIVADRESGRLPIAVVATVGTSSSTAMDPVTAIGEICRRRDVWLHVDAAQAGSAAICPEFRWIHGDLEFADSYCFNPHKWLLTNFDCDAFYLADRRVLIKALAVLPEYLKNRATESGAVIDYRDWQIPLGRRFRALKLWFVIRHYGAKGLRAHVRQHVALARDFTKWVEAEPDFRLCAPAPLNLVCFRHVGGDDLNLHLMERLNSSGKMYLTQTKLRERVVLRMAIGGSFTERRHVEQAWNLIRTTARELAGQ